MLLHMYSLSSDGVRNKVASCWPRHRRLQDSQVGAIAMLCAHFENARNAQIARVSRSDRTPLETRILLAVYECQSYRVKVGVHGSRSPQIEVAGVIGNERLASTKTM